MSLAPPVPSRPAWRRLIEWMGRVEHAFERTKAEGRADDDTRLRIFFVLSVFALAFLTLAVGATRAALFSEARQEPGPARAAVPRPAPTWSTATAGCWPSTCPTTASI